MPAMAALIALGACGPMAAQPPELEAGLLTCSGDLSAASPELRIQYSRFKQRIESGPLYRALVQRVGLPHDCQRTAESGSIRLHYDFERNATLLSQIDPLLEFSEQRAQFGGLTQTEAKALLQQGEKHAFGQQGCGIAWQSPESEESANSSEMRETVYRGDVCNCQARIEYQNGDISAVILRSAC